MTQEEIRLLRDQALSFFGTITASLSHEINNSVAIIGELSGLLEDLLLVAEEGKSVNEAKLKDLSQRISNQVKKGQKIIKRLNRFAHTTDDPDTTFDLGEVLDQLLELAQRFAFLKGVQLESKSESEPTPIKGNPFTLQQAVFICIRLALEGSKKNETITVSLHREDSAVKVITTCTSLPETEDVSSDLSFLSILIKELGGTVEHPPLENERRSLVLTIPRSVPGD